MPDRPRKGERCRKHLTPFTGHLHADGYAGFAELYESARTFVVKAGTEGSGRGWAEEGLPWRAAPNLTPDQETGAGGWTAAGSRHRGPG